jgi:hypothetical protein
MGVASYIASGVGGGNSATAVGVLHLESSSSMVSGVWRVSVEELQPRDLFCPLVVDDEALARC